MLGNFSCCNPTRLYFDNDAPKHLGEVLKNYGKKCFLHTEVVPSRQTVFTMK